MPTRRPVWNLFVLSLLGFFVLRAESFAQEAQQNSDKQAKKEPTQKTENESVPAKTVERISKKNSEIDEKEQEKREQAATIGSILLIGVLILGFLTITIILFWGRATRRLAKSRSSKKTVIDPLWYLKSQKKKESVSPTEGRDDNDRFDSTQN